MIANILFFAAGIVLAICAMEAGWSAGIVQGLAMSEWGRSKIFEAGGAPAHLVQRQHEAEVLMRQRTTKLGWPFRRWSRSAWAEYESEYAKAMKK